jgi:hypothetical protein
VRRLAMPGLMLGSSIRLWRLLWRPYTLHGRVHGRGNTGGVLLPIEQEDGLT